MTYDERLKQANDIRQRLEDAADDLAAHFEGGIYGDDENGNWIVGYGVSGSINIVVTPDHVEFGDARSAPFTEETQSTLAELRSMMEHC